MLKRNYRTKDVDMLLACKTIAKNLSENLEELSLVRTNWTAEYVADLTNSIDYAIENFLGLDKRKELREATARLIAIQTPAKRDLTFLKTQIEVDFNEESPEILKILGYAQHFRSAQTGDQEAMIALLFAFKKEMNEDLKNKIIANGTSPILIDKIIGYADQLIQANITQETLKETTKELSKEALELFNSIYDEVIGICKIASSYYNSELLKKKQFTFKKVTSNMGSAKANKIEQEEKHLTD